MVILKVLPIKGVRRFKKRGNLAPQYIRPYKILERIGYVAYRLELLDQLASVHNVFYVPMLCKQVRDKEQAVIPNFAGLIV